VNRVVTPPLRELAPYDLERLDVVLNARPVPFRTDDGEHARLVQHERELVSGMRHHPELYWVVDRRVIEVTSK